MRRLTPAVLLALACAVPAGCRPGAGVGGRLDPVRVGVPAEEPPAWAKKELAAFEAMERCYRDFMRRYVHPDGSTVVTGRCHHGNIDDILEAFFQWDKFMLLAASDELREKYVRVWKRHWQYGIEKGFFENGFYAKGYDAEHAGELLPMLWACLELAPEDTELARTNEAVAGVLTSPEWFHPEHHLFRYSWVRSRPITDEWRTGFLGRWRGECGVNAVYASGVWLAYLTSGKEKYRRWVLDYCRAWNRAAERNGGVFPYHIDTESMKPGPHGDGRWWKGTERGPEPSVLDAEHERTGNEWYRNLGGGTAGFDLERLGFVTPTRGWRNLPVAAAFLDRGEPAYASGLVSTVKAFFENAEDGLPAAAYSPDEGGWFRKKRWPHHVPVLLDKAYVLTWSPELARLMAEYPVERVSWLEQEIATWCNFTYNRRGGLEVAEAAFERARKRAERRIERAAARPDPENGDDLVAVTLEKLGDLDYVDGAQWVGHNARCGGPSPGPVGYFSASGRRGLPKGVAALVRHVERDSTTVLLYNANARSIRILVTGGYYGQHRIDSVRAGGLAFQAGARRVVLELPARALAEVELGLTRCAYTPTLRPQAE